ncbi:MAG: biotin transporter BioY [Comamonadaceae bacterium]|nr:MAG: biotin transporter BioY [Comamonadaceae bacterium]
MSSDLSQVSGLFIDPRDKSIQLKALAMVVGTVVLALSSRIQVPMLPVPMTLQTLAVTLVGALYGWRLGTATVVAWLIEGAIGLPVFAAGASGLPHLLGKTGGYLFSFPLVALWVGWLCEKGWTGHRFFMAFMAMLLGNALCLIVGGVWLAAFIGWEKAVAFGISPFLLGGLLKSVLGASLLKAVEGPARNAR